MEEAQLQERGVCREKISPERGKTCMKPRPIRPTFKKLQIVYYLSRNGNLEHPHYMEITLLAHQHLRLKDVMDRLTVLRGKAMSSLYSWSCKRSYKNGYVWNDLCENDVIYPSEGAEYVLKGSELVVGSPNSLPEFQPIRKPVASKPRTQPEEIFNSTGEITQHQSLDEEEGEEEEEEVYQETTTEAFKQTPGVRTNNSLTVHAASSSPPSATSSTSSEKTGGRPGEGDPVGSEPLLSRSSMLLSLIACGGSASFRKEPAPTTPPRRSGDLRRAAAAAEGDEAAAMIGCMSENPRFGGMAGEEKEYFSGSIVGAVVNDRGDAGGLKKSASHNQERSSMVDLEGGEKELENEEYLIGKCIPRKRSQLKK